MTSKVWVDWSGATAVVVCDHCGGRTWGVWLDFAEALTFAREHRTQHPDSVSPKGRPRVSVSCEVWDCDSPHYARGLCEKHYRAARRARRAASSEEVAA